LDLLSMSAGVVDFRGSPQHLVSVHFGSPVRATCRYQGKFQRRIQRQGDIDVLPAGIPGVWRDESPVTVLVMRLTPAFLCGVAREMGQDPDLIGLSPRLQWRNAQLEHIAWALKAEHESGYPSGPLYIQALGRAVAAHLLGNAAHDPAQAPRERGLSARQLARVMDYVDAHLDGDVSLPRLAQVAGSGPSHFKALFKRSTGQPVHQYVVRRRVERARALLMQGELPMSQVALEAGFSHQSHMARWVRRLLGVTPKALLRDRD